MGGDGVPDAGEHHHRDEGVGREGERGLRLQVEQLPYLALGVEKTALLTLCRTTQGTRDTFDELADDL